MSVYKTQNTRPLLSPGDGERLSNQYVFSGATGNTVSVPKGVFCLTYLRMVSGTVQIKDGDGNEIAPAISEFDGDHDPLRCDRGITLTGGNIAIAKGFVIPDVFRETA